MKPFLTEGQRNIYGLVLERRTNAQSRAQQLLI